MPPPLLVAWWEHYSPLPGGFRAPHEILSCAGSAALPTRWTCSPCPCPAQGRTSEERSFVVEKKCLCPPGLGVCCSIGQVATVSGSSTPAVAPEPQRPTRAEALTQAALLPPDPVGGPKIKAALQYPALSLNRIPWGLVRAKCQAVTCPAAPPKGPLAKIEVEAQGSFVDTGILFCGLGADFSV